MDNSIMERVWPSKVPLHDDAFLTHCPENPENNSLLLTFIRFLQKKGQICRCRYLK